MNDVSEKLIPLTRRFADDTSFGVSGTDLIHIKSIIDHDLAELGDWY